MENLKTIDEIMKESEEIEKRFIKLLRSYGFKFKDIMEAGKFAEEALNEIDNAVKSAEETLKKIDKN